VPPVSPNKQAAAGRELQEILAAGESVLARVKARWFALLVHSPCQVCLISHTCGATQVLSGRAAQLEATARSLEQDLGFVKEELTKLQRSVKTATTVAGPEVRTRSSAYSTSLGTKERAACCYICHELRPWSVRLVSSCRLTTYASGVSPRPDSTRPWQSPWSGCCTVHMPCSWALAQEATCAAS